MSKFDRDPGYPVGLKDQTDLNANTDGLMRRMAKNRTLRSLAAVAFVALAAKTASQQMETNQPAGSSEPKITHAYNTSHNWAGYTGQSFSAMNFVRETYVVVPEVDCPEEGDTYSSAWVGLGTGVGSSILYQTGIAMDCIDGDAEYHTWWEDYPTENEQSYTTGGGFGPGTLSPGDRIQEMVSITQNGMQFQVRDFGASGTTAHWTAQESLNVSPVPSPSDAECITETPTVGGSYAELTDFGTLNFTSDEGCLVVAGATNHKISSTSAFWAPGNITQLDMNNLSDTYPLATTSARSSGGDYTVTWQAGS